MKNKISKRFRSLSCGVAIVLSTLVLGGMTPAWADHGHHDQDREGFRDHHGNYHRYGYHHHHRGYWDQQNGAQIWINI